MQANIITAGPSEGYITVVIDKVGFHKQTSVGSLLCRIQFVYVLKVISGLFILIDNVFVRYRHRHSFSFDCRQTTLNQKSMLSKIPV